MRKLTTNEKEYIQESAYYVENNYYENGHKMTIEEAIEYAYSSAMSELDICRISPSIKFVGTKKIKEVIAEELKSIDQDALTKERK